MRVVPQNATDPPFAFSMAVSPMVGMVASKGMMSQLAVIHNGRLALVKPAKSVSRSTASWEI